MVCKYLKLLGGCEKPLKQQNALSETLKSLIVSV